MEQLTLDAQDQLAAARAWKADNGPAYAAIVEWARVDQDNGQRPAIDLYANLLRRPHFARALGLIRSDAVYTVNNNLRSELARLVMLEHPDIRFELRHSKADTGAPNATPRAGGAVRA